jgi:hypothetical protein
MGEFLKWTYILFNGGFNMQGNESSLRSISRVLTISAAIVGSFLHLPLASAQQGGPVFMQVQSGVAVGGGEIGFQRFSAMVPGKVVKGAPYSAVAATEMVQQLSDGNQINHKVTSSIYRDTQGRTRREESFGGIGLAVIDGRHPRNVVFISDPVSGSDYVLEPENKIARKMPSLPANGPVSVRTFAMGSGLHMSVEGGTQASLESSVPPSPPQGNVMYMTKDFAPGVDGPGPEELSPQSSTEPLGQRTIEGVVVNGKRITTTIPAGAMGNERPISTVTEEWFSPELQVVVLSTTKDPRMGETSYRLTNIQREEPSATLFTPPSDYTIKEFDKFPPHPPLPQD